MCFSILGHKLRSELVAHGAQLRAEKLVKIGVGKGKAVTLNISQEELRTS